jgi:hypothetical protein
MNWPYLYANRLPIISALSLLVGAAVKTAPPPGTKFDLYTWVYDFSHQFLNITNTRLTTSSIVTPPESTASPKS